MLVVLGIGVTVCVGAVALASTACIVPLQFEEQFDAAVNNDDFPPVITAAVPAMPGPVTIDTQIDPPAKFSIDVEDKDLDDTLHVRVFRNYTEASPSPPIVIKDDIPASGEKLRQITDISTAGWCSGITLGQGVTFEVVVADREFLPFDMAPLYRALPPGAESTRAFWLGVCQ